MVLIILTISIFYAIVITFLSITWYKDVKHKEDTDKRILVLEKRDAEKLSKKEFNKTIDFLVDNSQQQDLILNNIIRRVEKLERKRKGEKKDEKINSQR